MADIHAVRILCIGLEPKTKALLEAMVRDLKAPAPDTPAAQLIVIDDADTFASEFEQWTDESFDLILSGPAITDMKPIEFAQVLQNQAPETLKYYVTETTESYEPRVLIKNGFNACFVVPVDQAQLKSSMLENLTRLQSAERVMKTVRLPDIGGGDLLEFETFLYLPMNKKYIKYTAANQPIEAKKIAKLQEHQMQQLWLDHRDMNKFYQYTAKKMLNTGGLSATERQTKLREGVRGLFSDIFDQSVKADFDGGREMIKQCEGIISNYITKGASSNWYQKLLASIGDAGDGYDHASNVSTFAALFAIALEHEHPEDLAMAGLFHDLGLADLPPELQEKREVELTDAEKWTYYGHIDASIAKIKTKRIILPETVEKAIQQHHEAWHGRGFPKQLPGPRLSIDAQILSFADQFDDLTRFRPGYQRFAPLDAVAEIRKTGSINPELIAKMRSVLDKSAEPAKVA